MQYERETLQTLVSARNNYASASTTGQKALASSALSVAVQKVFAVAENYPDLKGNVSFLELQKRIAELESQIADRREFYNDAINLFNTRIQEVPDAWLANPMGLKPRAMFQATVAERLPATVSLTPSRT
jgi:LemA protein